LENSSYVKDKKSLVANKRTFFYYALNNFRLSAFGFAHRHAFIEPAAPPRAHSSPTPLLGPAESTAKGPSMATALQIAANRRNAQGSTGPRTVEGKAAVRLNATKHGMTAQTVILRHECALDYHEIRAALIEDYAPATSQELMLVDQVAAGYWRTIRARRFETAMFDNRLRTRKREEGKDETPDSSTDDEGCAVMLQVEPESDLTNYFRYDGTISRDYYRAINSLERLQAGRRRAEDRQERKARDEAKQLERIINHPDPDTVAEISDEAPPVREAPPKRGVLFVARPLEPDANTPVELTGFVSHYEPVEYDSEPPLRPDRR
jgi:hypothetical protein